MDEPSVNMPLFMRMLDTNLTGKASRFDDLGAASVRMAWDDVKRGISEMAAEMQSAAERLRDYERQHLNKRTTDGDAKAEANADAAYRLESTLARLLPGEYGDAGKPHGRDVLMVGNGSDQQADRDKSRAESSK